MTASATLWTIFGAVVLVVLALDLGVFHRKAHAVRMKEALAWSAVWIALALAYNLIIYFWLGRVKALEFLTGYVLEKSLSVDNLFVFLMLFGYFRVPTEHQHKVLFWGILGALVMRALFIAAGVTLIRRFEVVIYLFGAILIWSGLKMAFQKDTEVHPEKNPVLKLFRRFFPVTKDYTGARFFTRIDGRLLATPLAVVLVVVETTDVVFAADSIPAVLAITTDPFIVFTSNVFAVLGLRALYFALAGAMELFHHLRFGLSAVLVFIGTKMLLSRWYEMPVGIALSVVAGLLALSLIASLIWPKKKNDAIKE
jgi:tellurite resistance protein TerC